MSSKLVGKTVFLDPGHQGGDHAEDVARPVSDGRGGTKECQTTGMTTVNGVPEHTITWNVSQLVKQSLEAMGARVVLSRQDDAGWGGCVDERAAAANRSGADVAVSIHADGAPAHERGFHLIVPQLPIPDAKADQAQSGPGLAATKVVRDAYLQAGFPAATYAGAVDGLQTRHDIAGPALTQVPDVFLEMGNGANAEDAALLESQDGQLRHAVAIATGVAGYLLGLGGAPTASGSADGRAAEQTAPGQPDSVPGQPGSAPGGAAEAPRAGTSAQPAPGAQTSGAPGANAQAPATGGGTRATPDQAAPGAVPGASAPSAPGAYTTPGGAATAPQPGTSGAGAPDGYTTPSGSTPGTGQPSLGSPDAYSTPGAAAPAPGTTPGAPNAYSTPDAYTPGPPSGAAPGTTQQPGAAQPPGSAPSTDGQAQQGTGPESAASSLVTTAMKLLAPLAESLGLEDAAVNSQLINLAYTLAATLLNPGSAENFLGARNDPGTTQNNPGTQGTPGAQNSLGAQRAPGTSTR
ncbi:N-acetylmuramoyl-L-alanine amidase [Nocardia sp. BMG51109]|uniref:N-acetylmuramoyl-L-alanine amidase n=1 Tax=Nocardia sp. BMG51109 TaxID=1056816 RepID=UPI0004AD8510